MTEQQREHTVRLETWMRAACMRPGLIGANRYRSKFHMTRVAHQAVLDRSMAHWATRRLALFLTVPVVAPPPAAPVIVPPVGAGGAMPPPMGGGGGGFGGPPMRGAQNKGVQPPRA
jgi:hypothetical protein